jgi:hypothetical protein
VFSSGKTKAISGLLQCFPGFGLGYDLFGYELDQKCCAGVISK